MTPYPVHYALAIPMFLLAACTSPIAEPTAASAVSALTNNLSGVVYRMPDADSATDGDAGGTIYVAAFKECPLGAAVAGFAVVPAADLSSPSAAEEFLIEGLGDGVYHLTAFLDDNGDAASDGPRPGPGDMVHAPTGLGDGKLDCVEVSISGANTANVEIPLTGNVPGR